MVSFQVVIIYPYYYKKCENVKHRPHAPPGINFDSSAFVGVILFSGIAVNDGIVLIDHLSKGRTQTEDEIIERSSHRLRPIFTTSITTIMGLIPFLFLKSEGILFSKLSLSVIGGLIFSTIGSVILIPILYYTFFRKDKNNIANKKKSG